MAEAITGRACPYLGRCDDVGNYYAFPTDANCCYSERRGVPVSPAYQSAACLGEGWEACPRYRAAVDRSPAPAAPSAGGKRPLRIFRAPWLAVAAVAAIGMVVLLAFLLLRPKSVQGEPPSTLTPGAMQSVVPELGLPPATQAAVSTAAPELMPPAAATSPPTRATEAFDPASTPTLPATPSLTPTPAPSRLATSANSPTSTPTAMATPSRTPTPTPSPTRTRMPTATPSRTPTHTPSPTRTRTPTATPSRTPTRTASPTPGLTRPVVASPTATSTPLPAPTLVAPYDRQEFQAEAEIILSWQSPGQLPSGAYYAITVAYSHLGVTWYDDVPWTRATSWTLSEHSYLLDLSDDGHFRWSVQIVGQTGLDGAGRPIGVALSEPSDVRLLIWKQASGGGGGGGTPPLPTRPVPTPSVPPP